MKSDEIGVEKIVTLRWIAEMGFYSGRKLTSKIYFDPHAGPVEGRGCHTSDQNHANLSAPCERRGSTRGTSEEGTLVVSLYLLPLRSYRSYSELSSSRYYYYLFFTFCRALWSSPNGNSPNWLSSYSQVCYPRTTSVVISFQLYFSSSFSVTWIFF